MTVNIKSIKVFLILVFGCFIFKGCVSSQFEKTGGVEFKFLKSDYRPRNGKLTEVEMQMARVAWKYFENNYQETTGMVNAVDKYPSTTMWDIASYMAGLVSAYELGIIEKTIFDKRMVALLKTFNELSFFRGELPNKVYNSKTGEKVNYTNKPGEIGFSALDLGRLLIWLKIIKERYPQYGGSIDKFVLRWNVCNVLDDEGTLFGSAIDKEKKVKYLQEGRLGYEEYAAKGFRLWGFKTDKASRPEPFNYINIYGIDIPYDSRDPRKLGAHNYVVTESYALDGLEFGFDMPEDKTSGPYEYTDKVTAEFAQRIYMVQEKRFRETGIMTARTEHQLDGAPYFVYDAVFTDGYAWNTITEDGKYVPEFSAVALKGAIGLWALWETEYTDILFNYVANLYDPEKGFYEGIYENGKGLIKTFTSNNNGIILSTLLFKVQGKLLKFGQVESLWDKTIKDEFSSDGGCIKKRLAIKGN